MAEGLGFEYCSTEVLKNFPDLGSQTLLQILHAPIDTSDLFASRSSTVFTEILIAVDEQLLDPIIAADFFKTAISTEELAKVFCQVYDVYPKSDNTIQILKILKESGSNLIHTVMAAYIESAKLIEIGLFSGDTFTRQSNTKKRDRFYTQKKFNLLHEEFEGYLLVISKLEDIMSQPNNINSIDYAVNVVNLLIGHYLLDPNRVLDILLYIFSNLLIGNHEFIVGFLKKSLWWPKNEACCTSGFEGLNNGGCLAASNSIVLQLKKFPGPDLPETFKVLVSILIKEGFISFGSIYPHIPPGAGAMTLLEQVYNKSLEEEIFRASANALALAAPLKAEDDQETESTEANDFSTTKEEQEQSLASLVKQNLKVQMLKNFLATGLYWPSIFILSEYPFLAHVDKEVGELMNRLFSALIAPLHQDICSVTAAQALTLLQKKQVAQITRLKLTFSEMQTTRQLCFKPMIKNIYNKKYIFFFTQWTFNLPICHTKNDLLQVSAQFLKFFGPILSSSHANFIQLCDIVFNDLSHDLSIENKMLWLDYFRNYILPYIGHILNNSVAVDKAFSILSLYDTNDRFNLYGELSQVLAKNNPFVKISFGKAEKATKDTLKRISKENVSQMMKNLARISISNPLPCFLTIIQQIESYDNLNSLVVEMASSYSRYAWDNMTLAILMRLTATGRSNMLENGLNDRRWIQSLASFIGELCLNYPDKIDLDTFLLFLLKSLHANDNSELLVLKEIVSCMGGFQAITNLTQLQVNMVCCEPSLAQIVFETIDDQRYHRQKSGQKLTSSLLSKNYASELFILLSRANDQLSTELSISHLKILTARKDEISAIMHLICSLFSFFCLETPSLISLSDLVTKFHIPIPWAFELWRKFLSDDFEGNIPDPSSVFSTSLDFNLVYVFWKLGLYDINFADSIYDNELSKLETKLALQKEGLSLIGNLKNQSRATNSNVLRLQESIKKLSDQKLLHKSHCNKVTDILAKSSVSWFKNNESGVATRGFLKECILPRVVHSCFDAMFSAKFLFKLHEMAIEGFSLLNCFQLFFNSKIFFSTLFTSTPTEAENLGLFLSVILQELDTWRSEEVFNSILLKSVLKTGDDKEICTHSSFKKLLFDFHSEILADVSRSLEVTSYMSRINVITFLKNLVNIYPVVEDHCEKIASLISVVSKFDSRDDLKLASAALIGHVRARESRWVHMWEFYDMDVDSKAEQQKRREVIEEERNAEIVKKQEVAAAQAKKHAAEDFKMKNEAFERKLSERNSQASASSLNYTEGPSASSRSVERVKQSADRGRYDRYTGETEKKIAETKRTDTASPNTAVAKENAKEPSKIVDLPKIIESKASNGVKQAVSQTLSDLFSQKLTNRDQEKPQNSLQYNRSSKVSETYDGHQNNSSSFQRAPREPRNSQPPQRSIERKNESSSPTLLSSSGQASSKSLQRTPLPPQAPPPQRRAPLPPQVAPPPGRRSEILFSGRKDNRGSGRTSGRGSEWKALGDDAVSSERNSDRNSIRKSVRESGGNSDRTYSAKNSRSTGGRDRHSGNSGQRGSTSTDSSNRNQSTRGSSNSTIHVRQNLRPSLDAQKTPSSTASPLPPPSLPPPRSGANLQDSRHGKRTYENNDYSADKRRRR